MSQTGLMAFAVVLLGRVVTRGPKARTVAAHNIPHHPATLALRGPHAAPHRWSGIPNARR